MWAPRVKSATMYLALTPYFNLISLQTSSNFDSVREIRMTLIRRLARPRAYSLPMPSVAPVITERDIGILIQFWGKRTEIYSNMFYVSSMFRVNRIYTLQVSSSISIKFRNWATATPPEMSSTECKLANRFALEHLDRLQNIATLQFLIVVHALNIIQITYPPTVRIVSPANTFRGSAAPGRCSRWSRRVTWTWCTSNWPQPEIRQRQRWQCRNPLRRYWWCDKNT